VAGIQEYKKTKEAIGFLERFGIWPDIQAVKDSKRNRAGRGKSRGRKYVMKKGPLLVYHEDGLQKNNDMVKAFRNIPGLDLCHVSRLNLLQLAPGGLLGRFIIWT